MFAGRKTIKYVVEDNYKSLFTAIIPDGEIQDGKNEAEDSKDPTEANVIEEDEKTKKWFAEAKAYGYMQR